MRDRVPSPVYFAHIQKNAGNSARAWFSDVFGADALQLMVPGRVVGDAARTWDTSPEAVGRVHRFLRDRPGGVVVGNLPYGLHEHLRVPVRYVTVLREPIARCVSFWYHAYRLREHGNAWRVIEECGRSPRLAAERGLLQLSDDQTRYVAGVPVRAVTRRHVDRARTLIAGGYLAVGTSTRLAEVLRAVAVSTGRVTGRVETLNTAAEHDPDLLPPDAIAELHELNRHDLALYEWFQTEHAGLRV